jgi:Fur family ferric uptake transcriptional regulator
MAAIGAGIIAESACAGTEEAPMENQHIRKAGLKVTLPRVKVLEVLQSDPALHMTAEDVYKRLIENGEEIGLATVYRVLTQFEAAGLVEKHHFESSVSVFELNRGAHHDHIVCTGCGHVEEFVDDLIEDRQRAVAKERGFAIKGHSLIIFGECERPQCPHRREA